MSHLAASKSGVALFLAIAFGFSWAVAGGIWALGGLAEEGLARRPVLTLLMLIYMSGPALAAFICAQIYDRGRRRLALGLISPFNAWLVVAYVAPIAITLAAVYLTAWLGPADVVGMKSAIPAALVAAGQDPASLPVPLDTLVLVQWATLIVVGPLLNWPLLLSEELGWRGWLWDRWRTLGFWPNVLATGLVWGVWHAPLVVMGHNFPGMPVWGPLLMVAYAIVLSPILHLIRERGGTVWHAALFHGVLNTWGPASLLLLSQADWPWSGVVGVGGFAAFALAALPVIWLMRPRSA